MEAIPKSSDNGINWMQELDRGNIEEAGKYKPAMWYRFRWRYWRNN